MNVVAYKLTPLARRDIEFMQIQKLIDVKRQFLIEKNKKLRLITKHNCFLEEVSNDYNKYYMYIYQQKEDQIKALKIINDYIKNLTISGELSKQNINDAKEEQKKILREMRLIKTNLDSIINDTEVIKQKINQKKELASV